MGRNSRRDGDRPPLLHELARVLATSLLVAAIAAGVAVLLSRDGSYAALFVGGCMLGGQLLGLLIGRVFRFDKLGRRID